MYTTEDPPPVTEERSLTRAAQPGRRTDRRAAAQQLLTFLDPGARSATPRAAPRLTDGFGALRVLQLLTWDVKRKAQTCPSHPLKERGDAFHRRTPSTADNAGMPRCRVAPRGSTSRPSSGHPSARSPRGHPQNRHEPRKENSGITRKEAARGPGFVPSDQPRTPSSPGTHLGSGGGCSGGPGAEGPFPGWDPASPRRDSRECRAAHPGRGLYPKEEGTGFRARPLRAGGKRGGRGPGRWEAAAAPLLLRSAPAGARRRPRAAPRPPGGSASRSAPHRGTGESGERLPTLESPRGARPHGAPGGAVTPATLRAAAAGGGAGSGRSVGSSCGCSVGCKLGEDTEREALGVCAERCAPGGSTV